MDRYLRYIMYLMKLIRKTEDFIVEEGLWDVSILDTFVELSFIVAIGPLAVVQ